MVQVTTCWGDVAFIFVVGAGETLWCAEETAQVQQTIDGASDGIRGEVAVENGAIDGKKAGEVGTWDRSESGGHEEYTRGLVPMPNTAAVPVMKSVSWPTPLCGM